jgi:hypothetical protein
VVVEQLGSAVPITMKHADCGGTADNIVTVPADTVEPSPIRR